MSLTTAAVLSGCQSVGDEDPLFDAARSVAHRTETNDQGFWEAELDDGHVFVYIPSGSFEMGARDGEPFEQPVHRVELDGYWIGKFPVTVAQFRTFVRETGYETDAEAGEGCWIERGGDIRYDASWREPYYDAPDDHPVVCVSWNDASAFAAWLGSRAGLPIALPTEAQWEKAARGTDGRPYPWGPAPPDGSQANFADSNYAEAFAGRRNPSRDIDDGYAQTSPVDAYPSGASLYGVFDMAGNTIDWLYDWFDPTYYASSPERNPSGPRRQLERHKFTIPGGWSSNLQRSIRGGAWTDASGRLSLEEGGHSIRSDRRESTDQFSSDDHMGFRLAIDSGRDGSRPGTVTTDPRATVTERIGDVEVMFQYRRARVAGRERRLFGHDVPYGEPWSIGAPHPALMSADEDVLVEGRLLPAGTYAMEIIPSSLQDGNEPWTVVFKAWRGRLGLGEEVMRVQSPAQLEDNSKERLEVFFDSRPERGVIARVLWEFVEVHIALSDPAQTDTSRATPAAVMNGFGRSELAVSYRRGVARDGTVSGDIAATLEARGDLLIAGQPVAAGRYALSLVPRPTDRWTATLTRLPDQTEESEPLSLEATVVSEEDVVERLELYFDDGPDGDESLVVAWGRKLIFLTVEAPRVTSQ